MDEQRSVLLLSKDLFFVAKVRSQAEAAGLATFLVSSAFHERLTEAVEKRQIGILVDLSCVPVAEVPGQVERLRERFESTPICAFGPHVLTARLEAAQAAGCDEVWSRGQLDRSLASLLETWNS